MPNRTDRPWDAQRVFRSLKRYVPDRDAVAIADAARLNDVAHGQLENATTSLFQRFSSWHAEHGVVLLMKGQMEGLEQLYHAVYYGLASTRIAYAYYARRPDANPYVPFNNVTLQFARAITLGCWPEVEFLAALFQTGLAER